MNLYTCIFNFNTSEKVVAIKAIRILSNICSLVTAKNLIDAYYPANERIVQAIPVLVKQDALANYLLQRELDTKLNHNTFVENIALHEQLNHLDLTRLPK